MANFVIAEDGLSAINLAIIEAVSVRAEVGYWHVVGNRGADLFAIGPHRDTEAEAKADLVTLLSAHQIVFGA